MVYLVMRVMVGRVHLSFNTSFLKAMAESHFGFGAKRDMSNPFEDAIVLVKSKLDDNLRLNKNLIKALVANSIPPLLIKQ